MSLVENILGLRRTIFRVLGRRISERGGRPLLQLRVLRAIAKGAVNSQSEVAECLMIDAGAVSRLVDRLEGDGLLIREEGKDRRSLRLRATPQAFLEVEAFDADLAWLDEVAGKSLSAEELESFMTLVDKLTTGFGECLEP